MSAEFTLSEEAMMVALAARNNSLSLDRQVLAAVRKELELGNLALPQAAERSQATTTAPAGPLQLDIEDMGTHIDYLVVDPRNDDVVFSSVVEAEARAVRDALNRLPSE